MYTHVCRLCPTAVTGLMRQRNCRQTRPRVAQRTFLERLAYAAVSSLIYVPPDL